ncbi:MULTISPECIES: hypothetical protein [unclassified Cupriavidus]|uniref:hypothetical protein n=1 Tax=unclassified Cupriavidus TaxID=2640874 RepID=UPI00313D08C2
MALDLTALFGAEASAKESWDGYGAAERIVFSDEHDELTAQEMLQKRISAIFTPMQIADQWTTPKGFVPSAKSDLLDGRYPAPKPFKLNPVQFLKRADANHPSEPEPTASAFSQWLYSLYSDAYGDKEHLERGIELEGFLVSELLRDWKIEKAQRTEAYRRRTLTVFDDELVGRRWAGWRLAHNGLHAPDNATSWFGVEDLSVGGVPLRASPDLLYQNTSTGEVVIVEVKNSTLEIPSNLWPNIWGQLWCYAQIPLVRSASHVTVVGEVWGSRWHNKSWREKATYPHLYMRASVRRDPRAASFDRFFRTLFNIYRSA